MRVVSQRGHARRSDRQALLAAAVASRQDRLRNLPHSRRYTKSALVQASDVFNGAPPITPPPKRIWTFYDQDMNFWNHYGELDLFTVKDQPVNEFRPSLARYKGKIYPVDRVHSAWGGFEEQGKPGLNQLFMKDFYSMWLQHKNDPSKFPKLAAIRDDNGDGMIEVNRPEEIDALLESTNALSFMRHPFRWMDGAWFTLATGESTTPAPSFKNCRWRVMRQLRMRQSTSILNNVLPARSALGAGGCTDCHSTQSSFFFGRTLDRPFAETGASSWTTNAAALGLCPIAHESAPSANNG